MFNLLRVSRENIYDDRCQVRYVLYTPQRVMGWTFSEHRLVLSHKKNLLQQFVFIITSILRFLVFCRYGWSVTTRATAALASSSLLDSTPYLRQARQLTRTKQTSEEENLKCFFFFNICPIKEFKKGPCSVSQSHISVKFDSAFISHQ